MPSSDVNAHVFHEQGSTKFTAISGGEIEFQSGAVLDKHSGMKEYIKGYTTHTSTADGRLANYGHSIIKTTSSGMHFRLDAPEAGIEKFITNFTSKPCWVHATTATGQTSPRYGVLSTEACTVMQMVPTPIGGKIGLTVHLRGMTTVQWFVINSPARTTTTGVTNFGDVTFSTST